MANEKYTKEQFALQILDLFNQSEDRLIELTLHMNCIYDGIKPSTWFIQRYQDLKRNLISYRAHCRGSFGGSQSGINDALDRVILVAEDLNLIEVLPNGYVTLSTPSSTKGSWR
ncbi:hypothetical protein ACV3YL_13620 [Clostridium perfringens]